MASAEAFGEALFELLILRPGGDPATRLTRDQTIDAPPALLDEIAAPDNEGRDLIRRAADKLGLTARGYHRILRTARTIADLDESEKVMTNHLAEAISYRLPFVAGG